MNFRQLKTWEMIGLFSDYCCFANNSKFLSCPFSASHFPQNDDTH